MTDPRPPAHAWPIPFCSAPPCPPEPGPDDPGPEPPVPPKASLVLAPSMVVSAGNCPAPRSDVWDVPPAAVAAVGVSSTKSCQRRPLAGSACNSAAVTVVVTTGVTGSTS